MKNAFDGPDHDPRTGMLERVTGVLLAFHQTDVTVAPTELAARAKLPKATGHRIITEMVRLGLLERTVGGVRLGTMMFEIGQLVPRQRILRRIAVPAMAELRELTKETVHLAVLDHGDVLYVDIVSSRQNLASRVGGRMPSYATAVGKAMLAFATEDVLQSVLSARFRRLGPNTILDKGALQEQLRIIRMLGIATENEESGRDTACVGAPIRTSDGVLQGGLSVTGNPKSFNFERVKPQVRDAAIYLGQRIDRSLRSQGSAAAFATSDALPA